MRFIKNIELITVRPKAGYRNPPPPGIIRHHIILKLWYIWSINHLVGHHRTINYYRWRPIEVEHPSQILRFLTILVLD